jgi:hypothetical protein
VAKCLWAAFHGGGLRFCVSVDNNKATSNTLNRPPSILLLGHRWLRNLDAYIFSGARFLRNPWAELQNVANAHVAIAEDAIAFDIQYFAHAIIAIVLAVTLPSVLNRPLDKNHIAAYQILRKLGAFSHLETLINECSHKMPVMITQNTGKVYVGFVFDDSKSPAGPHGWIRLSPLISGYRDERQNFVMQTDYQWLHEPTSESELASRSIEKSNFDIICPVDTITSSHPFDLKTYARFESSSSEADKGKANIENVRCAEADANDVGAESATQVITEAESTIPDIRSRWVAIRARLRSRLATLVLKRAPGVYAFFVLSVLMFMVAPWFLGPLIGALFFLSAALMWRLLTSPFNFIAN